VVVQLLGVDRDEQLEVLRPPLAVGLANRAGPRWAAMSASMPSMRERNGAASPASAVRQSTLGPDGALARPV
jgi:hypothetical protein